MCFSQHSNQSCCMARPHATVIRSWFKGSGLLLPSTSISLLKPLATELGSYFWSCTRCISSRARHDILCQATMFSLPLWYFICVSDGGREIWILMLQWSWMWGSKCPAMPCCSYCKELVCSACNSPGSLLVPALTGAQWKSKHERCRPI